jgi:hypothetical protein
MQITTPKQLIETLSNEYHSDEPLMITWWSVEDVEMSIADEDMGTDKAKEVWGEIVYDLDNRTSDHVITYVNEELDSLIEERLNSMG